MSKPEDVDHSATNRDDPESHGPPHLDVIVDPIVDMVTGNLAGVETIHICSPTTAPTIGQWRRTLMQTLMTSVRWKRRNQIPRSHFCVTELSWDMLNHPELMRSVRASLSASGEDPRNLQLRVDAGVLRSAEDRHLDTLVELGETGLGLFVSGPYAPLHTRRHRRVLDIDHVDVSAVGSEPAELAAAVRGILDLRLTPLMTGVTTMADQMTAVAAGARLGMGELYRTPQDGDTTADTAASEVARHELKRFINQ